MRGFLVILLLATMVPAVAGELYKWVDENGTVHFSDRKQVEEAEPVELEPLNVATPVESATRVTMESRPDTDSDRAASGGRVTMYSTSWCGYCKKARRYFMAENIPFREHDIEESPRARRAYERLGGGGVPLIKVGDRTMNGFSAAGFERFYRP